MEARSLSLTAGSPDLARRLFACAKSATIRINLMPVSKNICPNCVGEPFLSKTIAATQSISCQCSYCGHFSATITLESLSERCQKVFDHFFEPTGDDDKVVIYGRDPDGDPLSHVLENLLGTTGPLVDDLNELMLENYDNGDGDDPDPYYILRHQLGDKLSTQWRRMTESLQNEARLFNPLASEILEQVFGPIGQDQTYDGFDVFRIAGPGKAMSRLVRARVLQTEEGLKHALEHPERELGPLPKGMGRSGRMNVRGISVFYGATDADIALAEVRPPVGSRVLLGIFSLTRELRLLDLDELGRVALDPSSSYFDPTTVERAARCDFLGALVDRLIMPVMPDDEERGYLITQAIADFLATRKNPEVDGICFKSAQVAAQHTGHPGRNVVLFHKASRVEKSERKFRQGRAAQLKEEDEYGLRWEPSIWVANSCPTPLIDEWKDHDDREVSLSLDLSSLSIREVKGIVFTTFEHAVALRST